MFQPQQSNANTGAPMSPYLMSPNSNLQMGTNRNQAGSSGGMAAGRAPTIEEEIVKLQQTCAALPEGTKVKEDCLRRLKELVDSSSGGLQSKVSGLRGFNTTGVMHGFDTSGVLPGFGAGMGPGGAAAAQAMATSAMGTTPPSSGFGTGTPAPMAGVAPTGQTSPQSGTPTGTTSPQGSLSFMSSPELNDLMMLKSQAIQAGDMQGAQAYDQRIRRLLEEQRGQKLAAQRKADYESRQQATAARAEADRKASYMRWYSKLYPEVSQADAEAAYNDKLGMDQFERHEKARGMLARLLNAYQPGSSHGLTEELLFKKTGITPPSDEDMLRADAGIVDRVRNYVQTVMGLRRSNDFSQMQFEIDRIRKMMNDMNMPKDRQWWYENKIREGMPLKEILLHLGQVRSRGLSALIEERKADRAAEDAAKDMVKTGAAATAVAGGMAGKDGSQLSPEELEYYRTILGF